MSIDWKNVPEVCGKVASSLQLSPRLITCLPAAGTLCVNPLRAGIVSDLLEYSWSSYGCKTTARNDPVIDFHPSYLALGVNEKERREIYAEYVHGTIPDNEIKLIREALQRGQLTGGDRFHEEIAIRTGIRFSNRGPGRPKNNRK